MHSCIGNNYRFHRIVFIRFSENSSFFGIFFFWGIIASHFQKCPKSIKCSRKVSKVLETWILLLIFFRYLCQRFFGTNGYSIYMTPAEMFLNRNNTCSSTLCSTEQNLCSLKKVVFSLLIEEKKSVFSFKFFQLIHWTNPKKLSKSQRKNLFNKKLRKQ